AFPPSAGASISDGPAGAGCVSAKALGPSRRAPGPEPFRYCDGSSGPGGGRASASGDCRGLSHCTRDSMLHRTNIRYGGGALGLITRTLLAPGDVVWFENPGYFRAREALAKVGAAIVPVPVDRDGLDTSFALKRSPKGCLAVVTPSHQCPLGVTLSLPRRLELLAWAAKMGAWIVEDDYDSEFRYRGHPLPALKSLHEPDRVFYAGSFSKVLSPGLRLGYLVVPSSELNRFSRDTELFAPISSLLDQMVVADFMIDGHFARHLKQMRRLYTERRNALVSALHTVFGDRIVLDVPTGGVHVIGRFPRCRDDVGLAAAAQRGGLSPFALSSCAVGNSLDPGLLLSFTNIPVEGAAREAQRLLQAIQRLFGSSLKRR